MMTLVQSEPEELKIILLQLQQNCKLILELHTYLVVFLEAKVFAQFDVEFIHLAVIHLDG